MHLNARICKSRQAQNISRNSMVSAAVNFYEMGLQENLIKFNNEVSGKTCGAILKVSGLFCRHLDASAPYMAWGAAFSILISMFMSVKI